MRMIILVERLMKLEIKKALFIFMVINSLNITRAKDILYIVKKNDTLSSILYQRNVKPIYGKNGALDRNTKIESTN